MKRWIFRHVGEENEKCSHGDTHRVHRYEKILVTKTGAVCLKVLEPHQTWSQKRIEFRQPIWRSESGELFLEDMQELGSNCYVNAADDMVLGRPLGYPCRIDGQLVPNYVYDEVYFQE